MRSGVGVEADARAELAGAPPAVAEVDVTASSAWPGRIQAGAFTERPSRRSSTTSVKWPRAVCTVRMPPSCAAVFGLMNAAFSQVILLSGFGSSCSQPRLAKRPS